MDHFFNFLNLYFRISFSKVCINKGLVCSPLIIESPLTISAPNFLFLKSKFALINLLSPFPEKPRLCARPHASLAPMVEQPLIVSFAVQFCRGSLVSYVCNKNKIRNWNKV